MPDNRALYRVPASAWRYPDPDNEEAAPGVPNAVLVFESQDWAYVWSATDPNPAVEALDGFERLAGSWVEAWESLPAASRDRIFLARVERQDPETGEVSTPTVRRADVADGDVVVADRLVPTGFGFRETIRDQEALDALFEAE